MSEYSESYQKVEYLEQVTTSIACLGESRVKLNTHIEQMNALFEQEEVHLRAMYKEIQMLEQTETVLRMRMEEKKKLEADDLNSGEEKLAGLEAQIERLIIQINSGESDNKSRVDDLNAQLYNITTSKNQTSSQIDLVTFEIDSLRNRFKQQIDVMTADKNDVQQQTVDQAAKLAELVRRYKEIKTKDEEDDAAFEAMKQQQEIRRIQLQNNLLSMSEEQKNRIAEFEAIIAAKQQEQQDLQQRLYELENEVSRLRNVQIQKQNQSENELQGLQIKMQLSVTELQELDRYLQTLRLTQQNDVNAWNNKINGTINDKNRLQDNIARINQNIENLRFNLQNHNAVLIKIQQDTEDERLRLEGRITDYQLQETNVNSTWQYNRDQLNLVAQQWQSKIEEIRVQYQNQQEDLNSVKSSYESTITNINCSYTSTVTSIDTYKQRVAVAAKLVDEYRPDYYVKVKKEKKEKKKGKGKKDEGNEDSDTSDSEDDHSEVKVVFITFGKVKTEKKNFKIDLTNGTYYLTFAGYVKKADTKDVLFDNRKYASSNQEFSYRVKLFDQQQKGKQWVMKKEKIHKYKVDKKKGTRVYLKVKID